MPLQMWLCEIQRSRQSIPSPLQNLKGFVAMDSSVCTVQVFFHHWCSNSSEGGQDSVRAGQKWKSLRHSQTTGTSALPWMDLHISEAYLEALSWKGGIFESECSGECGDSTERDYTGLREAWHVDETLFLLLHASQVYHERSDRRKKAPEKKTNCRLQKELQSY